MTDYPSNSRKKKAEEAATDAPRVEGPVVTGKVIQRPTPIGRKFYQTFIGGESFSSVCQNVLLTTVVPMMQDLFVNSLNQAINLKIYGANHRRSVGGPISRPNPNGQVQYGGRSIGARPSDPPRREISKQARSTHDFGELLLETRAEANDVLDRMFEALEKYGSVSVRDLYTLLEITPDWAANKWGWTSLEGANIRPSQGKYLLVLPPTVEFK